MHHSGLAVSLSAIDVSQRILGAEIVPCKLEIGTNSLATTLQKRLRSKFQSILRKKHYGGNSGTRSEGICAGSCEMPCLLAAGTQSCSIKRKGSVHNYGPATGSKPGDIHCLKSFFRACQWTANHCAGSSRAESSTSWRRAIRERTARLEAQKAEEKAAREKEEQERLLAERKAWVQARYEQRQEKIRRAAEERRKREEAYNELVEKTRAYDQLLWHPAHGLCPPAHMSQSKLLCTHPSAHDMLPATTQQLGSAVSHQAICEPELPA
jgi:hypothetical protein